MNSVTPIWPAVFLGMYLFLELLDWGLSLAAPFVGGEQSGALSFKTGYRSQ